MSLMCEELHHLEKTCKNTRSEFDRICYALEHFQNVKYQNNLEILKKMIKDDNTIMQSLIKYTKDLSKSQTRSFNVEKVFEIWWGDVCYDQDKDSQDCSGKCLSSIVEMLFNHSYSNNVLKEFESIEYAEALADMFATKLQQLEKKLVILKNPT